MELDPALITLTGIVGSQAHGLATADSDVDERGVFVAPSEDFFRFGKVQDSYFTSDPDSQFHEFGKFISLVVRANPSSTELLWLDNYSHMTPLGELLVEKRGMFLSAEYTKDAFLGFSESQHKLSFNVREDGATKLEGKSLKAARHAIRMVEAGTQLFTTGHWDVAVSDRDWYLNALPTLTHDEFADLHASRTRELRALTDTPLPAQPNWEAAEELIITVRKANFS